jgi:hypothetical protein
MIIVSNHALCPRCGHNEVSQHSQEYSTKGEWVTKQQRDTDPTINIACIHPAVFVCDPTWYTCVSCEYELPQAEIEAMNARLHQDWVDAGSPPPTICEGIGIGVINPRGLERFTLDGVK